MGSLSAMRVTVAGAGVFGLASALALARRGARVTVADPSLEGPNASSVAAGMLAPACEAALDAATAGRFDLLRRARDAWPTFAADLPAVQIHRDGSVLQGPPDWLEPAQAALAGQGSAVERRGSWLFTPEDWRIDAAAALAAMRARLLDLGARFDARAVSAVPDGEAVVLACGYGGQHLAPELARMQPIKGQLLRFVGGPNQGPSIRTPRGYLTPSAAGAIVGATMEAGAWDLAADAAATARLHALALELVPALADATFKVEVGVRAATPDGLPMVGRSVREGVWIAAGARRNGWLLAPLVAETLAARMAGEPDTETTAALDSGRFRQPAGVETNPPG